MPDIIIDADAGAGTVDGGRAASAGLPIAAPAPQPDGLMVKATESPPPRTQPANPAPRPGAPGDTKFFQDFKAGGSDPLAGTTIKEVLIKTGDFVVYIDQDLVLRWYSNATLDPNCAAPVFNRAIELQAKSEFLRQTLRGRDLMSVRRLIGEGIVVMFSTESLIYANAALDTAEKFINQVGRQTSRGWYFGPFFVFFAASVLIGLILYHRGHMRITTLPLVCALGGGIGAFISTAIGNERIPCAPSAGRLLHLLEALLRYTVGFAAGLLVWLATSGNLAIGFLNFANSTAATSPSPGSHLPLPASVYALIAVALLAGTSERLLPSLMAKFDDSIKGSVGTQAHENETGAVGSNPAGTPVERRTNARQS
ncbi:MAG: hypothetical protein JO069_21525 [Verrucomicrobia bacterium]|nr:hypothetical protein [Verrucomicrobiota bacterium]